MKNDQPPDVTQRELPSQNIENQRKEEAMPRRAISENETLRLDDSAFARALASLGAPSYLFAEVHEFPGVTALVDVLEPVILGVERAEWLHGFPSTLKPSLFDLRIPEVTPTRLAAAAMNRWRLTEAGALQRLDEEQDKQLRHVIRCLIGELLYRAVRARFASWPQSRVDPHDVANQLYLEKHERWIKDFDPSISQLSTFIYSHARPNSMSRKGQRSVGLRIDHPPMEPTEYRHQEDDIISRIMSEAAEKQMDAVELLRYHGFSYAEISWRTGLSVAAARTRVSRHLRKHRLRLGLDPRGKAPMLETEGD